MSSRAAPAGVPEIRDEARASERLRCLLRVAQVVNSSLDLNAVLEHILTQAKEILDAESGSIMLREAAPPNEDGERLRVLAAQGPRAQEIQGQSQRLGEGVAGWVALNGEPVLLHGQTLDERFTGARKRKDVRDALCVPLRADDQVTGVISLNNRLGAKAFSTEDLDLLTALSNQAGIAIRNAESFQEMHRQRVTVERLLGGVTRAQEEERTRISLLLHDGPAQTMFAALRNLEMVKALAEDVPDTLAAGLDELEKVIRQAIQETRAVMIDLRPPCLADMGLHSALRQYAGQFEQRTGIPTQVLRRGSDRRPPDTVEGSFYRIAQEALTNIWKHADAHKAWVALEMGDGSCTLEVGDDGKGFDPVAVAEEESQHLGMRSLRDRAELAGGRLSVVSAPGSGTRIRVVVPMTA